MRYSRLLALGLALAAMGGVIWWLGRGEVANEATPTIPETDRWSAVTGAGKTSTSPPPSMPEPSRLLAVGVPDVAESGASGSGSDGMREQLPLIRPTTLRGRIVDADSAPVAGARVIYLPDSHMVELMGGPALTGRTLHDLVPEALASTTSGTDGRFELQGQRARDAGRQIDLPGHDARATLFVLGEGLAVVGHRCAGFGASGYDAGDIRLSVRAAAIRARVVDESGQPVQGVTASPSHRRLDDAFRQVQGFDGRSLSFLGSSSGSDGGIGLGSLWPGEIDVTFRSDRLAPARLEGVIVRAGEVTDVGDVTLHRAGKIGGRIVDADERPVAGAEVFFLETKLAVQSFRVDDPIRQDAALSLLESCRDWRPMHSPAVSDADGRFERTGLDSPSYLVLVDADGFEPLTSNDVRPDAELSLALRRPATIHLLAVDAVDRAPVVIESARAFRRAEIETRSNVRTEIPVVIDGPGRGGGAVISRAGPVGTDVVVSAKGFATARFDVPGVEAPEILEHLVELTREATLGGTIRDERGAAVPDTRVTLEPVRDESRLIASRDTRTDVGGRYDFDQLSAGTWSLQAERDGSLTIGDRVTLEVGKPHADVDLVLRTAGSISGTVRGVDGQPAPGVAIHAGPATGSGRDFDLDESDNEGGYEIDGLAGGTYRLTAVPGVDVQVPVGDGEHVSLDLALRTRPVVRGRVLAGGKPQAGVDVRLERSQWTRLAKPLDAQRSDDDGRFVWTLDVDGSYKLYAQRDAGAKTAVEELDVEFGVTLERELVFGQCSIEGRVTVPEATDASFEGVRVRVRSDEPVVPWTAVDVSGGFAFDSILPGTYVVDACGGSRMDASTLPIELADEAHVRDVVLAMPEGARVEGRASKADGSDMDGWAVFAVRADAVFHHKATVEVGRYALVGLGPGEYRVFAAFSAYDPDAYESIDAISMAEEFHATPPVTLAIEALDTYQLDLTLP